MSTCSYDRTDPPEATPEAPRGQRAGGGILPHCCRKRGTRGQRESVGRGTPPGSKKGGPHQTPRSHGPPGERGKPPPPLAQSPQAELARPGSLGRGAEGGSAPDAQPAAPEGAAPGTASPCAAPLERSRAPAAAGRALPPRGPARPAAGTARCPGRFLAACPAGIQAWSCAAAEPARSLPPSARPGPARRRRPRQRRQAAKEAGRQAGRGRRAERSWGRRRRGGAAGLRAKMAAPPLASKAGCSAANAAAASGAGGALGPARAAAAFPELDFRSGARLEELNRLIQDFARQDQREYDDQRALEIHTAKDFIFSMLGEPLPPPRPLPHPLPGSLLGLWRALPRPETLRPACCAPPSPEPSPPPELQPAGLAAGGRAGWGGGGSGRAGRATFSRGGSGSASGARPPPCSGLRSAELASASPGWPDAPQTKAAPRREGEGRGGGRTFLHFKRVPC
ncbi:protein MB21D2 [Crotalus adamanteus]|uniref:Protein MB21D2 n=1 Tax=Crotalus adamanteus TaxID=8729 RepID=A0AAW1BHW0_CROAD